MPFHMTQKTREFQQCCGSGTGSVRIRNFWPDPDPIRIRNKHFGSGFESGSESGSKTNLSKGVLFKAKKGNFRQLWNISTFPRLTDNRIIGIHCPVTFCAGVNFFTRLLSTAARWLISRTHDSNLSRIQGSKRHRIPDPQYCKKAL